MSFMYIHKGTTVDFIFFIDFSHTGIRVEFLDRRQSYTTI